MEIAEILNSHGYPVAISIGFFIWLFKLVNKQFDKSNETAERLIKTLETTVQQQTTCQNETNEILKSVSEALVEFSKSQNKFSDALLEFSKKEKEKPPKI